MEAKQFEELRTRAADIVSRIRKKDKTVTDEERQFAAEEFPKAMNEFYAIKPIPVFSEDKDGNKKPTMRQTFTIGKDGKRVPGKIVQKTVKPWEMAVRFDARKLLADHEQTWDIDTYRNFLKNIRTLAKRMWKDASEEAKTKGTKTVKFSAGKPEAKLRKEERRKAKEAKDKDKERAKQERLKEKLEIEAQIKALKDFKKSKFQRQGKRPTKAKKQEKKEEAKTA